MQIMTNAFVVEIELKAGLRTIMKQMTCYIIPLHCNLYILLYKNMTMTSNAIILYRLYVSGKVRRKSITKYTGH